MNSAPPAGIPVEWGLSRAGPAMPPATTRPMTRPFLARRPAQCLATAVALALAPTVARAQQDSVTARGQQDSLAGRAHTVKKGDTLWEIAHAYLGDPFLWPDVYRLNTQVVENPHWIYPGEQIVLPGGAAAAGADAGVDPADAEALGEEPVEPEGAVVRPVSTAPAGTVAMPRTSMLPPVSAVRLGEFFAAPYVEREGGPSGAGSIVESADLPGGTQLSLRGRFQLNDQLFITPPGGTQAAVGDRYLVVAPSTRIPGVGQVMVPTGVLVVEEAQSGTAARARLTQLFEAVRLSDLIIPVPEGYQASAARPQPVEGGASGRVVWMPQSPLLASVQQFVIIDAKESEGVRAGDLMTLVAERRTGRNGVALPEVRIGTAQVLRVTPTAVSAVIVGQEQPAIRPGTLARVTARLP